MYSSFRASRKGSSTTWIIRIFMQSSMPRNILYSTTFCACFFLLLLWLKDESLGWMDSLYPPGFSGDVHWTVGFPITAPYLVLPNRITKKPYFYPSSTISSVVLIFAPFATNSDLSCVISPFPCSQMILAKGSTISSMWISSQTVIISGFSVGCSWSVTHIILFV